jgi:hypothetical protein
MGGWGSGDGGGQTDTTPAGRRFADRSPGCAGPAPVPCASSVPRFRVPVPCAGSVQTRCGVDRQGRSVAPARSLWAGHSGSVTPGRIAPGGIVLGDRSGGMRRPVISRRRREQSLTGRGGRGAERREPLAHAAVGRGCLLARRANRARIVAGICDPTTCGRRCVYHLELFSCALAVSKFLAGPFGSLGAGRGISCPALLHPTVPPLAQPPALLWILPPPSRPPFPPTTPFSVSSAIRP